MEEEYRTSSNFYRYINIIESRIPRTPPTIQCRDDSGIHDFDIAMSKISIKLSQYLLVDILINNIRVRKTRSGYAAYTDKQHHGISADLLARKWGIVTDNAKRNL